jgi:TRAP transporter 4TM/12TM fusion protein
VKGEVYMKMLTRSTIITIVAVAMSLLHLYTAGVRLFPAMEQRTMHLCFTLILVFLIFPLKKFYKQFNTKILSSLDFIFICFSLFIGIYMFTEYENIAMREGMPNTLDVIVSVAAVFLTLEATRRLMGLTMCVIVLVGFGYVAFGSYLPPMFAHGGYSFERAVTHMFLTTDGILGTAVNVSATVIIVFLIFGSFLEHTGGSRAFTNIGFALFGGFKGGAAKAAVLGSCLFGMMTGSQTANVAAVGILTIPLMIKVGYQPMMAAAIEALSSTGGMLVPPVMGAAAFIIPDMIGGTYLEVMKSALIPGLLFYTAVFMFIQVQASRLGIQKVPRSELPKMGNIFKENIHLFTPILVLLFLLIVMNVSTKLAGFWAVISLVAVSMLRKNTRMTPRTAVSALEGGARTALIVAIACASAGLIEGVISLTGLGLRFSEMLITIAGGNVFFLLILTMLASLVIGLPLPPVTAYLILAILAAPALIKSGIHPMAAHLFIFHFGVLGNITPPSAPCSFAAAGIAKTDPLKTTNLAFWISAPTFLVPFLFVYSPELLLQGSIFSVIWRVFCAFSAISAISIAFLGYCFRNLNWIMRLAILGSGFLIAFPSFITNALGLLCLATLIWYQKIHLEIKMRG